MRTAFKFRFPNFRSIMDVQRRGVIISEKEGCGLICANDGSIGDFSSSPSMPIVRAISATVRDLTVVGAASAGSKQTS